MTAPLTMNGDHHHDADQRGRVLDALEQHRQVGGGQCPAGARADRGESERDQQAPAAQACGGCGHAAT
jgi:hypothetical protein